MQGLLCRQHCHHPASAEQCGGNDAAEKAADRLQQGHLPAVDITAEQFPGAHAKGLAAVGPEPGIKAPGFEYYDWPDDQLFEPARWHDQIRVANGLHWQAGVGIYGDQYGCCANPHRHQQQAVIDHRHQPAPQRRRRQVGTEQVDGFTRGRVGHVRLFRGRAMPADRKSWYQRPDSNRHGVATGGF